MLRNRTKIFFFFFKSAFRQPCVVAAEKNSAIQYNATRPPMKPQEFPELNRHPTDDVSKKENRFLFYIHFMYLFIYITFYSFSLYWI